MEFLKKATKSTEQNSQEARDVVLKVLADIREGKEEAVRELARKFDKWEGDFILSEEKKKKLIDSVPERVKQDLQFAHKQVSTFAKAQRESLKEFETEVTPGIRLGQKVIPMDVAGCYVPGGRFRHHERCHGQGRRRALRHCRHSAPR